MYLEISMSKPVAKYLKDYQSLNYELESVNLEFSLHPTATQVVSCLRIANNQEQSLSLQGEELKLLSMTLNGEDAQARITEQEGGIEIDVAGLSEFELIITTEISPETNTALEGLYRTSGNYCTQCEAEGFRKITYFPDRPDVMTVFTTKIIADKATNPVMLANGNLIESGDLENGMHYAVWNDPFKKPSYLFALVAGQLHKIADTFQSADGRAIALEIFVEEQNIDKCDHAMESLKRSMKWDEERFGLIYDLDIYMIVAVDDFNMGAMENKGLNVFNSKFVLAKPDTATDVDFEGIEAVIAHEYFHNWTGNRVTCRDWFQLTLKEGLTVFRDQSFTADMLSPSVKRIEDVKRLRSFQFPEDAGPMSHPIQPQSYIEMNNFYTMTVYEKGAEVVRLYQTLLGRDGFRRGMDLYFERHDGQAVTVQDFRNAMADANDVDLAQMHQWYIQNGTPTVKVTSQYDAAEKTLSVSLQQSVAKSDSREPLLIPVNLGLLSNNGESLTLSPDAATQVKCLRIDESQTGTFTLTKSSETWVFTDVAVAPVVSVFRDFSAPVLIEQDLSDEQLAVLAAFDVDSFKRWDAMQVLMINTLKAKVSAIQANAEYQLPDTLKLAFKTALANIDDGTDLALLSMNLSMPDKIYFMELYAQMDIDALLGAWHWLKSELASEFTELFAAGYARVNVSEDYQYDKLQIARRKFKSMCLSYLALDEANADMIAQQYHQQANMTDVLSALSSYLAKPMAGFEALLEDFYSRWNQDKLVTDKWFSLQAQMTVGENPVAAIETLMNHPDYSLKNPNRARSVLGVFGRFNPEVFHQKDGAGYQLLAKKVIELDAINPQVAARMVSPLSSWRRLSGERKELMKSALESIHQQSSLSKDVFEIVSKSLAD